MTNAFYAADFNGNIFGLDAETLDDAIGFDARELGAQVSDDISTFLCDNDATDTATCHRADADGWHVWAI